MLLETLYTRFDYSSVMSTGLHLKLNEYLSGQKGPL